MTDDVSNYSFKTSGGAHIQMCPLCLEEHMICRFSVGTTFCLRPKCLNPHHRRK